MASCFLDITQCQRTLSSKAPAAPPAAARTSHTGVACLKPVFPPTVDLAAGLKPLDTSYLCLQTEQVKVPCYESLFTPKALSSHTHRVNLGDPVHRKDVRQFILLHGTSQSAQRGFKQTLK